MVLLSTIFGKLIGVLRRLCFSPCFEHGALNPASEPGFLTIVSSLTIARRVQALTEFRFKREPCGTVACDGESADVCGPLVDNALPPMMQGEFGGEPVPWAPHRPAGAIWRGFHIRALSPISRGARRPPGGLASSGRITGPIEDKPARVGKAPVNFGSG